MCLSIPGKVEKIEKDKITVDYSGEKREADLSLVDIKPGDYVIMSNKIVISKLKKKEAEEFLKNINDTRKNG